LVPVLYHLLTRSSWTTLGPEEDYAPASLVTEGFIHCSPDATTLLTVANRFYTDATEPMIALWIDPSQLTAEVRWEAPDPPAPGIPDRMPHVYGPIPHRAVRAIYSLQREATGRYVALLPFYGDC